MPVLTAYFDVSEISFLLEKDDKELEFFHFPYAYSSEVFLNQSSQEEFNKAVIEAVLEERKLKLSSCDLVLGGFITPPKVGVEDKLSLDLLSIFHTINYFYPVLVNNYSVMTKVAVLSFENCPEKSSDPDQSYRDDIGNRSIYPQIIPADIPSLSDLDRKIVERSHTGNFSYSSDFPIVLCGSRFNKPRTVDYLDYILALDLIRKPGIYDLYLDRKNSLILLSLLKIYKKEMENDPKQYFEALGTVINSPGDTECLVSSDVDTGQFFDVKRDNIYFVPVDLKGQENVSVKNSMLGSIKDSIQGGRAGLVIDTREGNGSVYDNVRVFNDCVRQLNICLPRF